MTAKPKPGRPPRASKASLERVEIRVTKAEKREWSVHAKEDGVSLSEWIRTRLWLRTGAAGSSQMPDRGNPMSARLRQRDGGER